MSGTFRRKKLRITLTSQCADHAILVERLKAAGEDEAAAALSKAFGPYQLAMKVLFRD